MTAADFSAAGAARRIAREEIAFDRINQRILRQRRSPLRRMIEWLGL